MVDRTLVPLHIQPGFFGNVFYDCKSNYSMNVQVGMLVAMTVVFTEILPHFC
jgi:hypothetical protein